MESVVTVPKTIRAALRQRARRPIPLDPPAQSHSVTSIAAADSMRGKTQTIRDMVYDLLLLGPMTDEQLTETLNMSPSTVRPRRVELMQAGRVEKVGERLTKSGRRAALWGMVP